MSNPDHFSESLEQFFGLKYLNSLMWIRDGKNSDLGSAMEKIRIRDKQQHCCQLFTFFSSDKSSDSAHCIDAIQTFKVLTSSKLPVSDSTRMIFRATFMYFRWWRWTWCRSRFSGSSPLRRVPSLRQLRTASSESALFHPFDDSAVFSEILWLKNWRTEFSSSCNLSFKWWKEKCTVVVRN